MLKLLGILQFITAVCRFDRPIPSDFKDLSGEQTPGEAKYSSDYEFFNSLKIASDLIALINFSLQMYFRFLI